MTTKLRILFCILLLSSFTGPGHAASEAAPSERIIRKALDILQTVRHTKYQHRTKISEKSGTYKVDCSGFIGYILKKATPDHYRRIPYANPYRPYAEDFYDFFKSLAECDTIPSDNWCRIKKFRDVKMGDIIVYKYTKEVKKKKGTTGHIMIVLSTPAKQNNGEYLVRVVDAARSPHGNDSRDRRNHSSGIGQGNMWFGVNAQNHPISRRWRSAKGMKHIKDIDGIAIGRAR